MIYVKAGNNNLELLEGFDGKVFKGINALKKIRLNKDCLSMLKQGETIEFQLVEEQSANTIQSVDYHVKGESLVLNDHFTEKITGVREGRKLRLKPVDKVKFEGDGAFTLLPSDYKKIMFFNIAAAFAIGAIIYYILADYILERLITDLVFIDNTRAFFDEVRIEIFGTVGAIIAGIIASHLLSLKIIDIMENSRIYNFILMLAYLIVLAAVGYTYYIYLYHGASLLKVYGGVLVGVFVILSTIYIMAELKRNLRLRDIFNDVAHGPLQFMLLAFVACGFATYLVVAGFGNISSLEDFDEISPYLRIYAELKDRLPEEGFSLNVPLVVIDYANGEYYLYDEGYHYEVILRSSDEKFEIKKNHLSDAMIGALNANKGNR